MKKYMLYMFIFISLFLTFDVSANTVTSRAFINSSCNVRTGPGTQNSRVASAYVGSYYNLVENKIYDDTNKHKDCNGNWYQIYYNGTSTGYVCEDHVEVINSFSTDDVVPSTDCEKEMSNLGFPSSYWGGLCSMKEKHSNWQFVALQTNLEWADAIENESPCGWNLIYGSTANQGFIDTTCNAYDSSYVGILPAGIAYYMDPRNFLSERFVFQFQYLAYDKNFATIYQSGVNTMLANSSFYKYHISIGNNFNTIVDAAASELNVCPIFTSARMLQELGSSDKLYNLYSGIYAGDNNDFYGYYNFYNIGVSDGCVQQFGTTYCGLVYAKAKGWNSLTSAIQGGIRTIAENYIARNQYTTYLQKFNVIGTSSNPIYSHQYMTNVAAPSSESGTTYSAYVNMGILDSAFVFYIPVYKNMNATINNSGGGAVDDGGTTAVPSTIPIHTIVTSSGYRYSAGYISNIAVGTDVATLKGTIESVGGNSTVVVTDNSGAIVSSGVIGTGFKVSINNQSSTEVLEVVIKGDTSGDGVINALDLLQVQKSILGTYTLNGAFYKAGETSGDEIINALDLLQVQKNILGTYTIVQ